MLLLSISCLATAQSFKEGSIRLKGGEEQPGLIGNLRPGIPDGIEFKTSPDSEIQIYYATDIEGYSVDRVFYSSYHQNAYREKEWIFAEILAEGDLTLIRKNGFYFLRGKNNGEFTHLSGRYKTTLIKFTRDCPVVSVKGGKVSLSRKELTEFINEYNECVASKKPNLEGMPRPVSIGVQVGYDYTAASFQYDDKAKFLSATKQSDKSLLQGGIELNFKNYKASNTIGLYAGALINVDSYSGVNQTKSETQSEVSEYSFRYREIKLPIGVEFSGPTKRKLSYYVRTGAVVPAIMSFKSAHPYTEISDLSGSTIQYSIPSQMTSYKLRTMWGGTLGADYKVADHRVRIQASWYSGKSTVTIVESGSTTKVTGKLSSFNLMTIFVF